MGYKRVRETHLSNLGEDYDESPFLPQKGPTGPTAPISVTLAPPTAAYQTPEQIERRKFIQRMREEEEEMSYEKRRGRWKIPENPEESLEGYYKLMGLGKDISELSVSDQRTYNKKIQEFTAYRDKRITDAEPFKTKNIAMYNEIVNGANNLYNQQKKELDYYYKVGLYVEPPSVIFEKPATPADEQKQREIAIKEGEERQKQIVAETQRIASQKFARERDAYVRGEIPAPSYWNEAQRSTADKDKAAYDNQKAIEQKLMEAQKAAEQKTTADTQRATAYKNDLSNAFQRWISMGIVSSIPTYPENQFAGMLEEVITADMMYTQKKTHNEVYLAARQRAQSMISSNYLSAFTEFERLYNLNVQRVRSTTETWKAPDGTMVIAPPESEMPTGYTLVTPALTPALTPAVPSAQMVTSSYLPWYQGVPEEYYKKEEKREEGNSPASLYYKQLGNINLKKLRIGRKRYA